MSERLHRECLISALRDYRVSAPPEHPVHPTICDEAAAALERNAQLIVDFHVKVSEQSDECDKLRAETQAYIEAANTSVNAKNERIAELEAALGKPLSEMVALHHEWQESILKLERENERLRAEIPWLRKEREDDKAENERLEAILRELREVSPSWNDWVSERMEITK